MRKIKFVDKRQFPHGMKLANLNYIVMHCSSNENTICAFIRAGHDRGDDPVSVIRRLSFRCMSRAAAERRLAVARMTNLSKITEPK